jgi:hypothetical protein
LPDGNSVIAVLNDWINAARDAGIPFGAEMGEAGARLAVPA